MTLFVHQVEFGVISQTGFAFHRILAALSVIVLKFDNLRYAISCMTYARY